MKDEFMRGPYAFPLVDFHTHILPKVDDGSKSVEESLEMIRTLAAAGVSRIALTPHFYPRYDDPERFLARRDKAFTALCDAVMSNPDTSHVNLIPGAEVEYFEGIACIKDYPRLKIGNTGCLLVEMPHGRWTSHMVDDLIVLNNSGFFRVVIAHVERYLFEQKKSVIHALIDDGIVMQSNADFFVNRRTSKAAVRWLKKGLIHIIGSDSHDMLMRPPNIKEACEIITKHAGEAVLAEMMTMAYNLLEDDIHNINDRTAARV